MSVPTVSSRLAGAILGAGFLILSACSGEQPTTPKEYEPGFGVSGLLFENNLVIWFRENDGTRSELFPQMYFTRADAENFPVWGRFPSDKMLSGGVPRDGIPALTNPPFVDVNSNEIGYLKDADLVLGAVVNGEVKAYPENILWQHEVANDVIGGVQVIMSFCPLTGTGLLFRVPDNPNTADKLELLPVVETTWVKWKELYPETKVISENTGFRRDYTFYPYNNYRDQDSPPLFALRTGEIDDRYPIKHRVLGVIVGAARKAYPFTNLVRNAIINDEVGGLPIVVVSNTSARFAVPYKREIDGQVLTFRETQNRPVQMTDNETGTVWNLKGEAISGDMKGKRLEQYPAYNAFWFAWTAFWPDTQVFEE